MKVLLTGALGNIGLRTLRTLLDAGHEVRCCDVESPRNRKTLETFRKQLVPAQSASCQMVWGDLRSTSLPELTRGVSAVIHLAGIFPPLSERDQELSHSVNVSATNALLRATEVVSPHARFIFASSMAVYGYQQRDSPPRTSTDRLNPVNAYGRHKVQAEELVKSSKLRWLIVRIGACFDSRLALQANLASIKEQLAMDPDSRVETLHTKDAALALTNAIVADAVDRKVLLLAGGPACRTTSGGLFRALFGAVGLEVPPAVFGKEPFYGDWLDTTESQKLLVYQRYSFDDTVREIAETLRPMRWLIFPLRPLMPALITRIFRQPG